MQLIVDGLLTQYEIKGQGKLILILHGWGDNSRGLVQLQSQLAKKYKVLAIDLPGFGGTQVPPKAWGLTDYAHFTSNALGKMGLSSPYAIIGHSNGGGIAIRGLAQGILAADRLVLLASAGIRGVYKGRMKALRYVVKAGKTLATPLPKSVKTKLQREVYQTVGSDMLVAEQLQETFKKIVADDVRADAAKLELPTLLVYGEEDQQTPVWYGETFHELIRDSTLEVLPGASHFVHLDRPQEVVGSIEDFLA